MNSSNTLESQLPSSLGTSPDVTSVSHSGNTSTPPTPSTDTAANPLFAPTQEQLRSSGTHRFARVVNAKYNALNPETYTYEQLYKWSVAHVDAFWGLVWDETGVVGYKGGHVVDNDARPSDNPQWFKEARLNWAENMLRVREESKVALIEASKFVRSFVRPFSACMHAWPRRIRISESPNVQVYEYDHMNALLILIQYLLTLYHSFIHYRT